MSIRISLLVLGIALVGITDSKTQESPKDRLAVRQIIEKAIAVAGGKTKLSYGKFWYRDRGTVVASNGEKVQFEAQFWYDSPSLFKYSIESINGQNKVCVVRILNNEGAWQVVNGKKQSDAAGLKEYRQLGARYSMERLYPLLEEGKFDLSLKEEKRLGGIDVHRIRAKNDDTVIDWYFNKKTGALAGYGYTGEGPSGETSWMETIILEAVEMQGYSVSKRIKMTVDGKDHIERERLEWKPVDGFPATTFNVPD